MHLIKIQTLQLFGDRTAPSSADRSPIVLSYRRYLHRCARKERLVGDIDLVASNLLFCYRVADLRRQLKDRIARYTVQRG